MAFTNTELAATLQRRSKGYLNVISRQIPLWFWLRRAKRYISTNGGTQIEFNLEYALDEEEASYDDYDTIPVIPQDNVEIAIANWKNYAKTIAINGPEKRVNSGQRIFTLLKQKERNALESLQQQWNTHAYEDGTANSGKRITGLKAIIASDPTTGTLFNLDRSTRTYWQNYTVDTAGAAYNTTTKKSLMWVDMHDLWIKTGRLKSGGVDNKHVDLILCTEAYFKLYAEVGQISGQRFTNVMKLDAGFTTLEFMGATMINDEDMPADAGSDAQAYFINSRFMELRYHPQANLSLTEMLGMVEQDAFSKRVLWMGELICTNTRKQGLHEGVQAVTS